MRVAQSVAEILSKHVVLEVEGIDRMYLNVYVPRLQIIEGVLGFLKSLPSRSPPVVNLLGQVIHAHKPVVQRIKHCRVGLQKVQLAVRPEPAVIQVRRRAALRVMERVHGVPSASGLTQVKLPSTPNRHTSPSTHL